MIQAGLSGSWHTLLTQLLLTSLLPHSMSVKDNRLESASVIRWCRWTQVVSVKSNIKESVANRMIGKWLPNVCVSLCGEGFLPVYLALSFRWWGGLLWQNFIVLAYFIVWIKWGCWGSTRNQEQEKKCQFPKIAHRKWEFVIKKVFSPKSYFTLVPKKRRSCYF